jgi:ubiquinone/menaquinone biosynthesis C-methylase UbiE
VFYQPSKIRSKETLLIQREQWHFDGNADEQYENFLVPTMFAPWAADFVELAAPQPGECVLDLACGTGVVTRLMAPRVGVEGQVIGLDLSPERLAVARSLPPVQGAEIEWREGDVTALPLADASFDIVCCHQGLQFIPDQSAALQEMFRALTSGGRLLLSMWRSTEHHPDAVAMAEALRHHVSQEASAFRNPIFSLGDAEAIEVLLEDAGFLDIVIRPEVKTLRFSSVEAFTIGYISAAGPLSQMVSEVDDSARAALLEDMSAALQSYVDADGLAIPTTSHVITAHT